MINRIRIKMGPIEFEAEGDSELIQREREQFFSALPQAARAITPAIVEPPKLPDTSFEMGKPEGGVVSTTPRLSAITDAASLESLPSYLNEKNFSTDVEVVMGVAYYLSRVKGVDPSTTKDIENALTDAKQSVPSNVSQCIASNIKKGFLQKCSEKKDGLKTYSVLEKGISWCESYVPTGVEPRKKDGRSRTPRVGRSSPLLDIPLDDLHIENYCKVSGIEKFDEQVLVVMLIYTKEKKIDYFSYGDIVTVFKEKFGLPATKRRVRYVFDTGKTMFDKRTEKKIASYKLMHSGLQKAEQIVAQQKNSNASLAEASDSTKHEASES